MKLRAQTLEQVRKVISDDLLVEFFRAIRPTSNVLAAKLINERLDNGDGLDQIFEPSGGSGFFLSVDRLPSSAFEISFGCVAGPLAGDGGEWEVVFDDLGKVSSLRAGWCWIS